MAISITHLSHFLSVFVLFRLTLAVVSDSVGVALTSAAFHIISPAGLFLSAPYAESSCALLSFFGTLLFVKSLGPKEDSSTAKDSLVLLSGISFGIATTFRSNGILNGLLMFTEAIRISVELFAHGPRVASARRLVATGLGGLAVGFGFLLPQYIAYTQFCGDAATSRTWCERTVPSIYTFVQDHYWYVKDATSQIDLMYLGTVVHSDIGLSQTFLSSYLPRQCSSS